VREGEREERRAVPSHSIDDEEQKKDGKNEKRDVFSSFFSFSLVVLPTAPFKLSVLLFFIYNCYKKKREKKYKYSFLHFEEEAGARLGGCQNFVGSGARGL